MGGIISKSFYSITAQKSNDFGQVEAKLELLSLLRVIPAQKCLSNVKNK